MKRGKSNEAEEKTGARGLTRGRKQGREEGLKDEGEENEK